MKKLVKENLNEKKAEDGPMFVDETFFKIVEYLQTKIYPKMNDDDLYNLNLKLKGWFNRNVK